MPNNPFTERDKTCILVEDSIRKFVNDKVNDNITRTFHPDELTGCERKILYASGSSNHKISKTNLEYNSEHFAKLKWIHLLNQIQDIKVLDCWVVASDAKYNMLTKVDCVIEISACENLQEVVYIRSISDSDFNKVKENGPTRRDTIRITIDMWLIEITQGIIIYENRDSLDFIIYGVSPKNVIVNAIKEKARELYGHKVCGSFPPRPYKTHSTKECQECEFFKKCWDGT